MRGEMTLAEQCQGIVDDEDVHRRVREWMCMLAPDACVRDEGICTRVPSPWAMALCLWELLCLDQDAIR